ncbi:MAG: outer membrane lipid asymmetry maintenance protein MlaD [Alphaproteobacteria bacterium]|nr:outer membrane lipid asymmetry maintenance protein MlaD [Alphaproteobacteria bacterium]
MQNGFVETLIGAAVVIVAGVFFYYGWNTTGSGSVAGYEVLAKFDRVDGIGVGTDVRLSGIKIGAVTNQELDLKSYRALLRMNIKKDIALPEDSSVKVASEGLLGGSYLSISPGGSDTMMKPGSEFESTQGSIDFVGLMFQAMTGGGADKKSDTPPAGTSPATPAPAPAIQ